MMACFGTATASSIRQLRGNRFEIEFLIMQNKDLSSPAFSMGKEVRANSVRKDRDLAKVGPFSYTKTFVDKKRDPSFSMGAKLESSLVRKGVVTADPTAYSPKLTLSKV